MNLVAVVDVRESVFVVCSEYIHTHTLHILAMVAVHFINVAYLHIVVNFILDAIIHTLSHSFVVFCVSYTSQFY